MCRVHSAPSWFPPSPCSVTSWQRASRLLSSLVASEAQQLLGPWARWSHVRAAEPLRAVWTTPESKCRDRHLLWQSAPNAHRGWCGPGMDPALCMALLERGTVSGVLWLAQTQDRLLRMQPHIYFLSLIFPLEDRSIWPISQVLWQPLKLLKQSKQTDTQIHNTKLI